MTELTCPDPKFQWISRWWSPCVHCGRLAWAHEQADPLQDLKNSIMIAEFSLRDEDYPPTMRTMI